MSTTQSHFFADVYRRNEAPWDIGGPQGALKCLAEAGTIQGEVLDVGCGTGENALFLDQLGRTFETIVDSGLFHVFGDESRPQFVRSLEDVLALGGRYILLCFSEQEPGDYGLRRVTQQEIRSAFQEGWSIESIHPAIYETTMHEEDPGGARAWVAVIQRNADQ